MGIRHAFRCRRQGRKSNNVRKRMTNFCQKDSNVAFSEIYVLFVGRSSDGCRYVQYVLYSRQGGMQVTTGSRRVSILMFVLEQVSVRFLYI